jgi:FkbM family methyltransferase
MEKNIRSLLIRIIGFEHYLALVSRIYLALVSRGFLKKKYPELFFLRHLLKPGDVCIDIGANVGYYSSFMSRHVGLSGKVIAIEPVALFANLFKKNLTRWGLPNVMLHRVALGAAPGNLVMGTPLIDGVLRHGLTHVLAQNEDRSGMQTYDVQVAIPDELFADLPKINFVKCDVEGYEVKLFPLFLATLQKHKPVIQIEITGVENRKNMLDILLPLGYVAHALSDNKLFPLSNNEALKYESDFYFLPQ